MAKTLTTEYLDQALGNLATKEEINKLATRDDLHRIEASIATKGDISQLTEQMHASFSDLQASVDRYLKRTETWHDEFNVLQARFKQVVDLLDQRGIIKEEETHLG